MISFLTGDLFAVPDLDAYAQGVNCVGKMGAGIAKKFRHKFPAMYESYRDLCARGGLRPGHVHVWSEDGVTVFNIASQEGLGACAEVDFLYSGLRYSLVMASAFGIRRIGMPRIGCGIGGLSWEDQVRPTVVELAGQFPVELVVVTLRDPS